MNKPNFFGKESVVDTDQALNIINHTRNTMKEVLNYSLKPNNIILDEVPEQARTEFNDELKKLTGELTSFFILNGRHITENEFFDKMFAVIHKVVENNFTGDGIVKKINKLLDTLIKLPEYSEDYNIVTKMKEEYANDKKVYTSSLMYLNKLYKQTKNKE